jgi:hypothetical protein
MLKSFTAKCAYRYLTLTARMEPSI